MSARAVFNAELGTVRESQMLKSQPNAKGELPPRLAAIKRRVSSGFYDSISVRKEIANAFVEYWEPRRARMDSVDTGS